MDRLGNLSTSAPVSPFVTIIINFGLMFIHRKEQQITSQIYHEKFFDRCSQKDLVRHDNEMLRLRHEKYIA